MEIRNVRTYANGFVIEWEKDGVGFGELTFNNNENGGIIDSEHMGEDFCKEIFEAFVKKYLPGKFHDNATCETCKWWGNMPHKFESLRFDWKFHSLQEEADLYNKENNKRRKHCFEIEKTGMMSLCQENDQYTVNEATIFTPSNFKCSQYIKMNDFHHYENYLQGLCEQFEMMCNLKVDVTELRLAVNSSSCIITFKDGKKRDIPYLIKEKKFRKIGKANGKKRSEAAMWLMENIKTFEQFKIIKNE